MFFIKNSLNFFLCILKNVCNKCKNVNKWKYDENNFISILFIDMAIQRKNKT